MVVRLVVALVLSYLLGSVVGGLALGRLVGVNLRTTGSGNAGATNAWRARGPWFALPVFLFDAGKGVLAVLLIARIGLSDEHWLPSACGLMVLIGHVYPIWFRFRGGKGFATLIGVVAALAPFAFAVLTGVWLITLLSSGYVSLATLVAVILYPVLISAAPQLAGQTSWIFGVLAAGLIIFTHRSNITRLYRGTENRFERVRIFKR